MKLLNLNFATLILRFYLLMAIVIGAFFIGMPWLSLLALPLFFISLLGIEFRRNTALKGKTAPASRPVPMSTQTSFQ